MLFKIADWVRNGDNRKAVVIASDIAKYELNPTGEYTQGAGSVSMLIVKAHPLYHLMVHGESQPGIVIFKPRRQYKKSNILIEAAKYLIKIFLKMKLMNYLRNHNQNSGLIQMISLKFTKKSLWRVSFQMKVIRQESTKQLKILIVRTKEIF